MDMDHEIALMYASSPFGIFQPRTSSYSPFGNIVLRVVRPRPRIEDLVAQFLENINSEQSSTPTPAQNDEAIAVDPTPGFDISERMAREMQEQEDREQQMRSRGEAFGLQTGDFMSSIFGGFHSTGNLTISGYHQKNANAEAGPSTIKLKPKLTTAVRPSRSMPGTYPITNDSGGLDSGDSSKSAGKQRARLPSIYDPTLHSDSMDLLDGIEAALKHEINKFDFPERLEFTDAPEAFAESARTPSSPVLADSFNNAPVHTYERVLTELLAGLDAVANDEDEEVQMRRLHLVGRIKKEMDELDRKVLELWAANRRYVPM